MRSMRVHAGWVGHPGAADPVMLIFRGVRQPPTPRVYLPDKGIAIDEGVMGPFHPRPTGMAHRNLVKRETLI